MNQKKGKSVEVIEPPSFPKWLKQKGATGGKRYLFVIPFVAAFQILNVIANFLPSLFQIDFLIEKMELAANLPKFGHVPGAFFLVTHFALVAFLLYMMPRSPSRNWDTGEREEVAFRQFFTWWHILWATWFLMYFAFAFMEVFSMIDALSLTQSATESCSNETKHLWYLEAPYNFLNNIQTGVFISCFWILSEDSFLDNDLAKPLIPVINWSLVLIILLVFEIVFGLFVFDGGPAYSREVFGWISGFAAGTFLAMLVGRLESKFINPPLWIIALLFFYAAIQSAYAGFISSYGLEITMLTIALVLKYVLFLYVTFLIVTGRLVFYLKKVHELDQSVENDFNKYFKNNICNS